MAPQHSIDQSVHSSASPSSPSEVITNSLFGLCALVIGIITIWQGKKLRTIWSRALGDHEGSTMAYELDDTHIESGIDLDVPPQAFTVSINGENGIHAPAADPIVQRPSQTPDVQPDGQADVITPLGPEAYTTPLPNDGPTASECRNGQLPSSLSLSGARPVPSRVESFDNSEAM